jgi:Glycosyltransferases involved in cell wall biogenesis
MTSLSVVIPSFNDAVMLRACLLALSVQTRPADEIIVVDNNSADDTAEVARAAGARVVTELQHGVWPATIAGFDAATGSIVARIDADSVPPPDWLERVEAILLAAPPLSAVTGPGDFYGANRLVCWIGEHLYIGGYFWFMGRLLGHPPLFGSNFAMHSAIWAQLRPGLDPTRPRVHDDLQLSYRLTPEMTVIYEKSLRVGVSARPFSTLRGFGRRLGWGGLGLWQNRGWRRNFQTPDDDQPPEGARSGLD